MTQPDHEFRVVLRGYEPAEVDRVVAALVARAEEAEERVSALEARVAEAASASATPAEPPSYEHLGERVGQILALAEHEALEMRDRAAAETEGIRKLAEQAATDVRDAADQYADQRKRDADTEATRLLADARRAADEERDAAERDAAARRQEGEALFEQQRADAAAAAADFETTLAERRERTAAEFRHQQSVTQAQLDDLAQQVETSRAAAQKEQESAEAQARRTMVEAEERADTIIREAKAAADRIRSDSDRELAAATQRRDSINAQLTNVRQMLATLSGSATGFIVDPIADDTPEDVSAEPQEDPESAEVTGREPAE
ncbi:MAG TPA: DivIVA domain-containing protein [Nocardioides sp.]|nr:DivIVA domain-containing protein [Nocardioides sp.]